MDESTEVFSPPRRLIIDEIPGIIDDYRAASRYTTEAGFEIHNAYFDLIEQFMKGSANHRSDEYNDNLERADRVGMQLSSFADFTECSDSDPEALGLYIARELSKGRDFVLPHIGAEDGD
ncbi:12-oxophytodienoate reductase 1-like [Canna indica]|uniref:12-oxophytodienoate reductase 1-like n=1 Tax=Canna indica TaxID=4628 RepID=A0AAQ3Q9S2_9LILI|nr:12-oxophytodienoate reductase 1-like [Canna indica]